MAPPLPGRRPRGPAEAGRVRDGHHHPDGVPRATSSSSPTSSCGPRTTASRWARAEAPRPARSSSYAMGITDLDPIDARTDLRAVPEPRARLHARCRHRLRRAQARRGHPVRDGEVRRRQGRHDRHLRQDQGQERHQGLRARAGLPVRDGRPPHQGHARRRPRQGHRPQRHHRPQAPALQRGGRDPGDVRERTGREEGHRHRQGRRGPGPADGCARGRRDHVQRAHHRPRAGLGPAHRRRHHHAVGLPAAASRSAC